MRSLFLILLSISLFSCEEDPEFYLKDIESPRLDSVLQLEDSVIHNAQYLFGRSSGKRDFPVRVFFYAPDSAEDVRFFRSEDYDQLAFYREFFPDFERTNSFWYGFDHPLYENDLYMMASYRIADTFYLTKSLQLLHWEQKTGNEGDVDIDTRNPTNPRFRWERDNDNSDEYLISLSDRQDDLLTASLVSDTNYRFYDVFAAFDHVGPEYTQPELIENESYNLYLMGIDTASGWVRSYRNRKFISRRE